MNVNNVKFLFFIRPSRSASRRAKKEDSDSEREDDISEDGKNIS